MKALFYGAAAASMAGLLLGMALEEPIAPTSSYGQQLLISHAAERAPSAFDSWTPTEGAPPPFIAEASTPSAEDVEQALSRLAIFGGGQPRKPAASVQVAHVEAQPEQEPYLPSRRGDILAPTEYAPVAYDVAAAPSRPEPARWERRGQEAETVYDGPPSDLDQGPSDRNYPDKPVPYGRGYR